MSISNYIMISKPQSGMSHLLEPFIAAMQQASGLSRDDAKTSVYYAASTHRVNKYERFPQLVFQGDLGTGKTSAKDQLAQMVCNPREITGKTEATIRDQLAGATTALIDEKEKVPALEDLLTDRYARKTGQIAVNTPMPDGTYRRTNRDIYGASVVCKRRAFGDGAVRSRAIVIHTKHEPGEHSLSQVPDMAKIVDQINIGGA